MHIKQIDSIWPCLCTLTTHRERQNVVRTSITLLACGSLRTSCSCHVLTSSTRCQSTHARPNGICLLSTRCFCERRNIQLSRAWDKGTIRASDENRTHDLSYTGQTLKPLRYWERARSHLLSLPSSCILQGTPLLKAPCVIIHMVMV